MKKLTEIEQELWDAEMKGIFKGLIVGAMMIVALGVGMVALSVAPDYDRICPEVRNTSNKILYPDQTEDCLPGDDREVCET